MSLALMNPRLSLKLTSIPVHVASERCFLSESSAVVHMAANTAVSAVASMYLAFTDIPVQRFSSMSVISGTNLSMSPAPRVTSTSTFSRPR